MERMLSISGLCGRDGDTGLGRVSRSGGRGPRSSRVMLSVSSNEGLGRLRLRMARTLLRAGLFVRSARLPRRRSLTVAEGLKSSRAGAGSEREESEERKEEEGESEEEEGERTRVGEVGIGT